MFNVDAFNVQCQFKLVVFNVECWLWLILFVLVVLSISWSQLVFSFIYFSRFLSIFKWKKFNLSWWLSSFLMFNVKFFFVVCEFIKLIDYQSKYYLIAYIFLLDVKGPISMINLVLEINYLKLLCKFYHQKLCFMTDI